MWFCRLRAWGFSKVLPVRRWQIWLLQPKNLFLSWPNTNTPNYFYPVYIMLAFTPSAFVTVCTNLHERVCKWAKGSHSHLMKYRLKWRPTGRYISAEWVTIKGLVAFFFFLQAWERAMVQSMLRRTCEEQADRAQKCQCQACSFEDLHNRQIVTHGRHRKSTVHTRCVQSLSCPSLIDAHPKSEGPPPLLLINTHAFKHPHHRDSPNGKQVDVNVLRTLNRHSTKSNKHLPASTFWENHFTADD